MDKETQSEQIEGDALKTLVYQLKELEKCASEDVKIRRLERELEKAVCNAIYNIIKDEVGTVVAYDIKYRSIPIKIHIRADEVYLEWEKESSSDSRLKQLIKYAPKLCKKLEKRIKHCKDDLAKEKKELQVVKEILTPLAVEGALLKS